MNDIERAIRGCVADGNVELKDDDVAALAQHVERALAERPRLVAVENPGRCRHLLVPHQVNVDAERERWRATPQPSRGKPSLRVPGQKPTELYLDFCDWLTSRCGAWDADDSAI